MTWATFLPFTWASGATALLAFATTMTALTAPRGGRPLVGVALLLLVAGCASAPTGDSPVPVLLSDPVRPIPAGDPVCTEHHVRVEVTGGLTRDVVVEHCLAPTDDPKGTVYGVSSGDGEAKLYYFPHDPDGRVNEWWLRGEHSGQPLIDAGYDVLQMCYGDCVRANNVDCTDVHRGCRGGRFGEDAAGVGFSGTTATFRGAVEYMLALSRTPEAGKQVCIGSSGGGIDCAYLATDKRLARHFQCAVVGAFPIRAQPRCRGDARSDWLYIPDTPPPTEGPGCPDTIACSWCHLDNMEHTELDPEYEAAYHRDLPSARRPGRIRVFFLTSDEDPGLEAARAIYEAWVGKGSVWWEEFDCTHQTPQPHCHNVTGDPVGGARIVELVKLCTGQGGNLP